MTTSLSKLAQRAEKALENHLPNAHTTLQEAMRYATLGGGKRLRACLVYASAQSLNSDSPALDYAACAVEAIHAYSLIHDDLPAMDDDDLRRGKPSTHKAYGEAEAILAGDALNTFAFELLANSPLPDTIKIKQIQLLAKAAGYAGMVGGQSLDMANTQQKTDLETLKRIHQGKTGALIRASIHLGACSAADYLDYYGVLEELGQSLGLAYQIQDDILDATADTATLGKTAGKDTQQEKNTYLRHYGITESQAQLAAAQTTIQQRIQGLPNPKPLTVLIQSIFARNH